MFMYIEFRYNIYRDTNWTVDGLAM